MSCKLFIFFALLSLVGFSSVQAETDSLRIIIDAPQLKNKQLYLCSHFNEKVYKQDSLTLSSEGKGVFHKKTLLPEGLYLVYIDNTRYFDLLLADKQSLSLSIDTADFVSKNKIHGAEQSEAFLEYAGFIASKQKERSLLTEKIKSSKTEGKTAEGIAAEMKLLDEEVSRFQRNFALKHKDQWVGKFFNGLNPVLTGPHPSPKNREEATKEFYFQKDHFFDNIDLDDPRFWRTNYFPQLINTYIQKQVEAIPDSTANAASGLVAKTIGDTLCFQLMLTKLTAYALNSQLIGLENTWAKLAEDYYLKGKAPWVDSTFLKNLRFEYDKIKHNRMDMRAHNLNLRDTLNHPVDLYNIGKNYTLLCFYEPSCGHCKTIIPNIHKELHGKFSDKGLDIACVCIMTNKKEWTDFINTHQLTGEHWHNLWDLDRSSYYWQYYDTSITPGIYLLDENKKIIAKKINVENLKNLLEQLLTETPKVKQ